MKLLVELFGERRANNMYNSLKTQFPEMHEDYYVRNAIRSLSTF